MLEPQVRQLLLASLRPPLGYELDRAIGTTFTLDLLALLTAPLAFTLFELEQRDGRPSADPLALLKATRDHADTITIFCQAGRIAVPPENQLLYSHLEDAVVETTVPHGVFHPKLWVLRYVARSGPVRYRLLCLSRNLTFDRSWDVALRLDGVLRRRKNAYAANHPLGDFIAALPGLAVRRSMPKPRKEAVEQIADELRRVEFERPEGFDEIRFHPLGVPGYRRSPFDGDMRRTLIVSPFVDGAGLNAIVPPAHAGEHVLLSRTESLARLGDGDAFNAFESVKVLDDAAESELEAAAREDEEEANLDKTLDGVLRGLHAKVYVAEAGWDARVWIGSANATEAALRRNVEFMVELVGKSSRCGVNSLLSGPDEGVPSFGDLLTEYEASEDAEVDELAEALQREAERLQSYLAEQRLVGHVDGPDDDGRYGLTLARSGRKGLTLPDGSRLRAWLITQAPSHAWPVDGCSGDQLARLENIELEQLTSFVAFELELRLEGRKHTSRFVLNVPLRGAPRGRRDAILRSLLRDKDRVLRYLLLVLAEAEGVQSLSPADLTAIARAGDSDAQAWSPLEFPLFEGLVRAVARDPAKLTQIERLIEDLGDDGDLEQLLPDGFREVWEPIWAARGR